MKNFILLLTLFSSLLLANSMPKILKSYATNQEIDIAHIAEHASKFQRDEQDKTYKEFEILWDSEESSSQKETQYLYHWVMVELDENLSSGTYWIEHSIFDFTEHSFDPRQSVEKFSLLGRKFFSFNYDKTKDNKRYFLRVMPSQSRIYAVASFYTPQSFSQWSEQYTLKLLLSFFLFGLIFMAAIYNGALYLYNREKSFLYYMLMQFFMVIILFYQTDLIEVYLMRHLQEEDRVLFFYFIVLEMAIIFILFFIRSFLETKKYLPFHDKILYYITLFAMIDLVSFFIPLMFIFQLYTFILLYVLWVAWLRLKQGYKPAIFFLMGWFALMLGVFFSDFLPEELFWFNPLLVGSTIEALFLAVAISYKMKEVRHEKEEQKELLVHQSRLASMGEMLGNIAHQWRQPLTRLGYILMNIEKKDTKEHHSQKLEEASIQLEFMSQTIDDFRDFYTPHKEKVLFSLAEETLKVLDLMVFSEIEVSLNVLRGESIMNHKNEYKQVLLNLLSNARDILLERKIQEPKIIIEVDGSIVKVSDNAGGVNPENIQKIFDPYFSTKAGGLGIGLYMSKMIVEKNLNAILEVENGIEGAVFSIQFK